MRLSSSVALVMLFTLVSLLPAGDPPKAKQRFSADAIALFTELSRIYEINGSPVAAGKWDSTVLDRLSRSAEADVRELVRKVEGLKVLQELKRAQGKRAREIIREQTKKWPDLILEKVREDLVNPNSGNVDSAAKFVEKLMGNDADGDKETPQQAMNKEWYIACQGNGLEVEMRKDMRKLAVRGGAVRADLKDPIAVTVGAETGSLGAITLTNRTDRTLHHCLIFTRLEADVKRIDAVAAQERFVGEFILPALGFDKKTVDGSLEAARLRHDFNKQDKGVMVYVPEIPPKGKVTALLLAQPEYYLIARGASMSIWCDELVVDPRPADNFAAARQFVEKLLKRTIPAKAKTGTPARASAPNPGTGDLFYKGAVWKGIETLSDPFEIEILSREGENYRADMRWKGKHGRYIEGTIKDGILTWQGAKGEPNPGTPHTGKITGAAVEGELFINVRGKNERRTFKLEYVPPIDQKVREGKEEGKVREGPHGGPTGTVGVLE